MKKNPEQSESPFSLIKKYLREGEVPNSADLAEAPLSFAAAVALRKMARADGTNPEDQQELRQKSREVLSQLNETDLTVLSDILTSDELDKDSVVKYLQARGVTEIPLLSSLPTELKNYFLQFFSAQYVVASQYEMTDFGHIRKDSDIPDWFREAVARKKAAEPDVQIFKYIQERWFIALTFLLGILTAIGFQNNLGLELHSVIGNLDLFVSIYGAVAVTRSVIQLERAEEWLMLTRGEVRTEYSEAFKQLVGGPEAIAQDPKLKGVVAQAEKLSRNPRKNWDPYQVGMGLKTRPEPETLKLAYRKKRPMPSLLDQWNGLSGQEVSQDEFIDRMAGQIREKNFKDQPPSVAIVIPTYQTSIEEMEKLLVSAKDQAYPIRNVYVVYNDNPNDPNSPAIEGELKVTKKQAEFLAFEALVDRLNADPGRNDLQITLLAQGARGKREAMAMGFATALGNTYLDDLQKKYPRVPREELNTAIGNLDLEQLPDFRHDFILNIDSDTRIIDPFAVLNAVVLLSKHTDAGATTGDVRVANGGVNLLTQMTKQRYRRAFFVERAAQQDQVTCDSGPFVMIRQEALAPILDEWYYQEQRGKNNKPVRSTYGDDRHFSTLILREGWKSLLCPDSAVETDSPIDWKTFLKQQLRWNKSFNRENFLVLQFIHKLSKYDQFDIMFQQTFPFAMLYILGSILSKGIGVGLHEGPVAGAEVIAPYIMSVVMYNELFFGLYGMLTNDLDLKFLASPTYIDYHFGALLWLKLKAIAEMTDTQWGTKGGSTGEQVLNTFQQNKGRILLELHEQIVSEVRNEKAADPNWTPDQHKPHEVPEDGPEDSKE